MSNNQLLVPENSITMQNMVGEGKGPLQNLSLSLIFFYEKESLELYTRLCYTTGEDVIVI